LAKKLKSFKTYNNQQGLSVPQLIVDEASMLVFPHFLALSTLVGPEGQILLAGDHRQLSPIVAHDWENEDRPTIQLFRPFVSSFEAVRSLAEHGALPPESVRWVPLQHTFRLPAVIRSLIRPTYRRDGIHLTGPHGPLAVPNFQRESNVWRRLWLGAGGLFLVLHDERSSRRFNEVELEIVQHILSAGGTLPAASLAIMSPHCAQRSVLQQQFEDQTGPGLPIRLIDTVERLQGGEAPTIIYSATASDPAAISRNVDFILNLNRANVAFSRTMQRLIVVCSRALIDYIPTEVEQYDDTVLWKTLRRLCVREIGQETIRGRSVRLLTTPPDLQVD
jgi:hypothetical protein